MHETSRRQSLAEERGSSAPRWPFWVLAGMAAFGVLVWAITPAEKPDPAETAYLAQVDAAAAGQNESIRFCKAAVLTQLRAPSTAQMSAVTADQTIGIWTVTGAVDSQNGFGAMLRSYWQCETTRDGDAWRLVKLDVVPA